MRKCIIITRRAINRIAPGRTEPCLPGGPSALDTTDDQRPPPPSLRGAHALPTGYRHVPDARRENVNNVNNEGDPQNVYRDTVRFVRFLRSAIVPPHPPPTANRVFWASATGFRCAWRRCTAKPRRLCMVIAYCEYLSVVLPFVYSLSSINFH